jgi:DNA-binding CsgD family transcriptional regulator
MGAAVAGGSLPLRPGQLTVAVRPSGSLARSVVAGLARAQPLLPRWRLRVVDDSHSGDGCRSAAADVAVVGAPELGGRVEADGAGLVFVLQSPVEAAGWGGAGSLVLFDDPPGDLARAVEETALGRVWICDRVAPLLPKLIGATKPHARRPVVTLTGAEAATLALLLSGRSNAQIAAERGVSVNTVKSCVRVILRKYGCSRRAELIAASLTTSTVY